jgi:toxin ParE1/3/4
MTLVWSPESIHDLISLRAHIGEHDPAAAKRVALHVIYCVEHLLSENPQLGNPGRVPGTRELVIPKTPYIVPYRIHGMTIEIRHRDIAAPPLPGARKSRGDRAQTSQKGWQKPHSNGESLLR